MSRKQRGYILTVVEKEHDSARKRSSLVGEVGGLKAVVCYKAQAAKRK